MKMFGKMEVQLHTFLTLALDVGEWSVSCAREKGPHWMGGWVGPGARVDAAEKKKISCSYQVVIMGPFFNLCRKALTVCIT
jgi:hypothetical protein